MIEALEDIDARAAGIALVASLGMALMVFSKGWAAIPMWAKLSSVLLCAPLTYLIVNKMLNQE